MPALTPQLLLRSGGGSRPRPTGLPPLSPSSLPSQRAHGSGQAALSPAAEHSFSLAASADSVGRAMRRSASSPASNLVFSRRSAMSSSDMASRHLGFARTPSSSSSASMQPKRRAPSPGSAAATGGVQFPGLSPLQTAALTASSSLVAAAAAATSAQRKANRKVLINRDPLAGSLKAPPGWWKSAPGASVGNRGPHGGAHSLTALLAQTRSESAVVRADAVDALAQLGAAAIPHLGIIARLLNDDCVVVRIAALEALTLFGGWAQPHAPHIAALLGDDKWMVKAYALDALAAAGREAVAPHVDTIARLLSDTTFQGKRSALQALGRAGEAALPHVATITDALRDTDASIRRSAVQALADAVWRKADQRAEQGAGASQAVSPGALPSLRSFLAARLWDVDAEVRRAAFEALGDDATPHLAGLARQLCSEDPGQFAFAAEALKDFGAAGRCHVRSVLPGASPHERERVVKFLVAASEADQLMIEEDPAVRLCALQVMRCQGGDAIANHLAVVARLLADDDALVRKEAVAVLATAGPVAVEYAVNLLNADEAESRISALQVIGGFAKEAEAHADAIAQLLRDSDADVRAAAADALSQLATGALRLASDLSPKLRMDVSRAKRLEAELLDMVTSQLGWVLVNGGGGDVVWTHGKDNLISGLRSLQAGQLLSHIPALGTLTWKVPLAEVLSAVGAPFWPRTWCVPETSADSTWTALRDRSTRGRTPEAVCEEAFGEGTGATVIVKPNAGSQGKGISLARTSQELLTAIRGLPKPDVVVQEYIDRPLLLDGFKWDARIYALVLPIRRQLKGEGEGGEPVADATSSPSPWVCDATPGWSCAAFLAGDGLARVCIDPYELSNTRNLHRSTMHLTNYSLNKMSAKFVHSEDPNDGDSGSKRTLTAVLRYLEDKIPDMAAEAVWARIEKLVRETIDALTGPLFATAFDPHYWDGDMELTNLVRTNFGQCFQIIGLDVLLDDSGGLWLLEVNSAPSFDIVEVKALADGPQSTAEINQAFAVPLRGTKLGRLCRCGALPTPHTHQHSPIDVAVKRPVLEGALSIITRARDLAPGGPAAWTEGTIYKSL